MPCLCCFYFILRKEFYGFAKSTSQLTHVKSFFAITVLIPPNQTSKNPILEKSNKNPLLSLKLPDTILLMKYPKKQICLINDSLKLQSCHLRFNDWVGYIRVGCSQKRLKGYKRQKSQVVNNSTL
jgi:hypothetical protein